MTEIVPFDYSGHQVRTVMVDGAAWFIAADVCTVLDIRNARDAVGGLDEDERGVATADTPGGQQEVLTVNEAGLYSLIFRSRKASAKRFKRWVTHEVLPTIRRTGNYSVAPVVDEEKTARVIATFYGAGIGDPAFWAAKAAQLAGRMLGEAPQYDPKTRPLTVQPFLASLGLTEIEIRKVSGTFGKKLKAAYRAVYGDDPPTIDDLVGRHMVPVAQYREEHRALFEQVCTAMGITPKDGAA